MPLLRQDATLHMEWCLDCHRHPQRYLREPEDVFSVSWKPPADQLERGQKLMKKYGIHPQRLTDCSVCHR
jgi:hypothetical protein